jgi:hypothetical protein
MSYLRRAFDEKGKIDPDTGFLTKNLKDSNYTNKTIEATPKQTAAKEAISKAANKSYFGEINAASLGLSQASVKGSLGSGGSGKKLNGLDPNTANAIASKKSDSSKEKIIGEDSSNVSINIVEVGKAARLSLNDLLALSTYVSGPTNLNLLAAWVYLLYNGSGAVNKTVRMEKNPNKNDQPITISGNMLMYMWTKGNSIVKGYFHKGIVKIFKKTPAFKEKFFEDIGEIGTTLVTNSERIPNNPMSGSTKHNPSLAERMLNKIHPKFTEELEKYVNVLKGKVYLALPANILGSIQYAINYINGIVTAFAQMINEVYQGCLNAIREFVAAIDSVMGVIMQWLLTLIDQIIPLDFICLILDILSLFIGDITIYTNLFSHSAKISDVLKTFNIDIPIVSDFLEDPIEMLEGLLPQNIRDVINVVNSVANDPMGYLGSVLNEYGYGYMMNYLQGDIMGGVLKQFGAQAPILYPINGIMQKYGFSGKIQLTDPNEPSPNVVLPPIITELRDGIEKTFDGLGRSAEFVDNIKEDLYRVPSSDPFLGIKRVY